MEIGLVSSLIGAQLGSFQMAVAAQLAQQNASGNAFSVAELTAAAAQNFTQRGGVASGIGADIDIIA
jgi:hypothetical protein